MSPSICWRTFNSIKVRLKPLTGWIGNVNNNFQFHKGAIETGWCDAFECPQRDFQFHKGAIETNSWRKRRKCDVSFNSIKVRLKRWPTDVEYMTLDTFNSIKVRLKPAARMAIPSSAPAFQFHKGAIETLVGVPMVAASNGFQLHKGAIETQARRRLRQQRGAFNSIKVRLKPLPRTRRTRLMALSIP